MDLRINSIAGMHFIAPKLKKLEEIFLFSSSFLDTKDFLD